MTPASANNFKVPIELVADYSDLPGLTIDESAIFWWNDGWSQATDFTVQVSKMQVKAKTKILANAKWSDCVDTEALRARQ